MLEVVEGSVKVSDFEKNANKKIGNGEEEKNVAAFIKKYEKPDQLKTMSKTRLQKISDEVAPFMDYAKGSVRVNQRGEYITWMHSQFKGHVMHEFDRSMPLRKMIFATQQFIRDRQEPPKGSKCATWKAIDASSKKNN